MKKKLDPHHIDNYITVTEAAKKLSVQYCTLLSWIKKDVGDLLTEELVIKKSSWLIHIDAVKRLKKMIVTGEISSREFL